MSDFTDHGSAGMPARRPNRATCTAPAGHRRSQDVRGKGLVTRLVGLLGVAICAAPVAVAGTGAAIAPDSPRIASAWRVLRAVDCARCHGKTYDGLAAPSIVDYAATQDRQTFIRMVLDGDPPRGMPGYRSTAYVLENIDDIYRYFCARAKGDIGPDYRAPAPVERR